MSYIISTKYLHDTIEDKLNHLKTHNIKHLMIDKSEFKTFDQAIFMKELKQNQIQLTLFDPLQTSVSINDKQALEQEYETIKEDLKILESFNPEFYLYELPTFFHVVEEYDKVEAHLKQVLFLFRKVKTTLLLKSKSYMANAYTYILKKMNHKQLKLLFDPTYFSEKESLGTVYRQLGVVTSVFLLADENKNKQTTMLGHGVINLKQLINKINKDQLNVYYLANPKYNKNFEAQQKVSFFQKLFDFDGNEKRASLKKYAEQLFEDKKKNIAIGDVYEYEKMFVK